MILDMMMIPDNITESAAAYLRIYFTGIPFLMLYNFCAAVFRSTGCTKIPMVCLVLGGILKLAENVIYRDYPQLNVSLTGEEMEQNRKDFAAYLKEHGITNLMIDSSDSNIGNYFDDYIDVNPNTIGVNQVYYYKVEYLADGNAEYSFIKAGTVDEN